MEQSLYRKAHAVLSNHAEYNKLRLISKPLHQHVCVAAFENVEGLLFKQYLLIIRQIFWEPGVCLIRNLNDSFGQRFRHKLSARRSLHAVRRKDLKFSIVRRVKAAV